MNTWLLGLLVGLYVLSVLLLVPWVLLKKTVHPTAVVAWIFTIVLLPYLGAVLCLLLGANRVRRRQVHRQQVSREFDGQGAPRTASANEEYGLAPPWSDVAGLIERVTGNAIEPGNAIDAVEDTDEAFAMLKSALRAARSAIDIQFYIFRSDDAGKGIRDLLIDAAQRGVQVRFQYDGFGSIGLTRKFLRPLTDAGVQVATFLPGQTFRERWSINLRNHRKLVIIDGDTAFTGGLNVGDEYLGLVPSWGNWVDTFVRVRGPVVGQLHRIFAEDWYYATEEKIAAPGPIEHAGRNLGQAIASGPADRLATMPMVFQAALGAARERVTLATGYFIPPDALLQALQATALRGVQVRVLVAGASTFFITRHAGRDHYAPLLRAGVEIYEYEAGLYHSKLLGVDDAWGFIGSPNFDARSMSLNFEAGICAYGSEVARWIHEQVEQDLAKADRIDPETWEDRPMGDVLLERSTRLLAPVL